jgi:hypothetical protein
MAKTMASIPTLQLASLAYRHPSLELRLHSQMAVIRLTLDARSSVVLEPLMVCRSLTINHRSIKSDSENEFERLIGWEEMQCSEPILLRIVNTFNEREITEKAAIAIMGLVANDLEGIVIKRVLPIGSGGDYVAELVISGKWTQVEVSGIREGAPSDSRTRLRQKCEQVLKKSADGFASVTTFNQLVRGGDGIAHTFLHYVQSTKGKGSKRTNEARKKRQ